MLGTLDAKDLSFLGGAVSTLVAALSYWAKTRHDQRRATRIALYYLLEIHYHISRTDKAIRDFPNSYLKAVKLELEKRGLTLTPLELSSGSEILASFVWKFTQREIEELLAELKPPLEKSLSDLAREDPILAFRLRGLERPLLALRKIEEFSANESPEDADEFRKMAEKLRPIDGMARRSALDQLDKAIRSTAWRCDAVTHIRTLRLLTKPIFIDFSTDQEFKELIRHVVEAAASEHHQEKGAGDETQSVVRASPRTSAATPPAPR